MVGFGSLYSQDEAVLFLLHPHKKNVVKKDINLLQLKLKVLFLR